jgi:hypothetical protein
MPDNGRTWSNRLVREILMQFAGKLDRTGGTSAKVTAAGLDIPKQML